MYNCSHCMFLLNNVDTDEDVAKKLQKSNPEAFKNVVRRLLEANGRGMWQTDDDTLEKLRELYSDADDMIEQIDSLY